MPKLLQSWPFLKTHLESDARYEKSWEIIKKVISKFFLEGDGLSEGKDLILSKEGVERKQEKEANFNKLDSENMRDGSINWFERLIKNSKNHKKRINIQ